MKKLLLNAMFIGLTTLGFAQTPFTEKTVHDINKRFIENPDNDETAPEFVLSGSEGQKFLPDPMKKMTDGVKHLTWETTDLTIKQYGKVAIANGITKHSFATINDNVTHFYHVRGTYVYEFQKDKWRKVSAHHTNILPAAADEEAAIKKLLVEERKAYFAGDQGIEKFWKNDSNTTIITSYTTGSYNAMSNERRKTLVAKFTPGGVGNIGTITSSKVKVYGNVAVADVEITTNYKNGSEAKERNMVVLEKNGDDWQIVKYSLHGLPKDKTQDSSAIVKVIEKETQAWKDRDAEARIACLANVPHGLLLVYHGNMASNNGVAYSTNEKTTLPESIKTQTASMGKADGSTFKNENYVITIKGGTAFVAFDQVVTATDGKKQHFHEVRNLERIEGLWKIVYVGAVTYTPN
jgi:hypothetical protein